MAYATPSTRSCARKGMGLPPECGGFVSERSDGYRLGDDQAVFRGQTLSADLREMVNRMRLMAGACYVAIHEQDAGSDDRRVHRWRAGLYSPRTGHFLLDPAERRRGVSAQPGAVVPTPASR